ncbi:MAG: GDP-mannose 4,6-dehydratase [Victivallaceae bacterium]|nr:GDP-mannose 4,6-dehydratase [Victivallaceae bacterium]
MNSNPKHYLVTGGAGFIGSHLSEKLIAGGNRITVIDDLSTGDIHNLDAIIEHPQFNIIIGSVLDSDLMEPLVRNCDAIFHLASAVGVKLIMARPVETIEKIFDGTAVVFKYAARYRKKVLITSTSEVYGKSKDVPFKEDGDRVEGSTAMHRWAYACAKSLDEFLALAHAKESELPVVVVRLFNTVGPRQAAAYGMVIPNLIGAALKGLPLNVHGDGKQTRCFCHVADVVEALCKLMTDKKCEAKVINIGSSDEISILELAGKIIKLTNSKSEIKLVPYEQVYPNGGFEDMQRRVPSIERIKGLIGWQPQKNLDDIIRGVAEEISEKLKLKI